MGLLIQGSVQPPPVSLPRAEWELAMRNAGVRVLGGGWIEWQPDPTLSARVDDLVRQKYSQPGYNEKR
jgi:hypothetical protein